MPNPSTITKSNAVSDAFAICEQIAFIANALEALADGDAQIGGAIPLLRVVADKAQGLAERLDNWSEGAA